MHITAFDRKARLACVYECSPNGAAGSDIDVGVFEHDHGVLAAEFEHHWKQALGGGLGNPPARGDAAGEDEFVDFALHERCSRFAFARKHLENVVGNSGLAEQPL